MALQEGQVANAGRETLKLWDGFLERLVDQALIVLSTKEVEPETDIALSSIHKAIDKTYWLLQILLKKDSRRIFYERQYVIAQEIFKLLEHYNEKERDKLANLLYQLRDMTKHRDRLQA